MAQQLLDKPSSLRVALCQVATEEWDVTGNFARICQALEEAADQQADLAITPECALHGYGFAESATLPARLVEAAEPLDGERLRALCALAKRRQMDIVFGFAEREAKGHIYNSAAYLSREGALLWTYRKVHCRDFEEQGRGGAFTAGDQFVVSERAFAGGCFSIGAMICFDREVTETARCLRALGAQIIACPLATNTSNLYAPAPGKMDNEQITRCRAAENEVFIVVVNHASRFNGGSFVVGPTGEPLCQLGSEAEVRTLALDIGSVETRFHSKPLGWMGWGYRRPEVYRNYGCGN